MKRTSKAGIFLTVRVVSKNEIILKDQIYGEHRITEPVLTELLQCPAVTRLRGVSQHGITGYIRCSARITRYEHSVGAFLLVRKVGGSLEEQIAALLHDVSHTAFSHSVDGTLSKPGESFHETMKHGYLWNTPLPDMMNRYQITHNVFEEELYPLVERPAPHLCADRLDYALRDTIVTRNLRLTEAQQIYQNLTAVPDPTSSDRTLAIPDPQLALKLARGYIATDEVLWCNAVYLDLYRAFGQAIAKTLRNQVAWKQSLWTLPEKDLWLRVSFPPYYEAELRTKVRSDLKDQAEKLNKADPERLRLPKDAKVRTIDPEVLVGGKVQQLNEILPEWGVQMSEYLARREAEREPDHSGTASESASKLGYGQRL